MALEVGIVGLPSSGKTTLFEVLTGTRGVNVGVAAIPDERLTQLARVVDAKKVTPAAIRVVDVPGTGPALLGNLRQVDALLVVVDGFSPGADPALKREVDDVRRILDHLEAGHDLRGYGGGLPPELEPLTTKELLALENGPAGIDLKLEAELAELDEQEAAEFREGPSALGEVVRRLFEALDLISFFTASEKEARAWTLRQGETALDAAATVHTDLARGFIRCEVIRWDDLVEAGSHAEAARRGLQRLEGKTYVVQDGDVLNVRFNV